jgi:hypothetical protein
MAAIKSERAWYELLRGMDWGDQRAEAGAKRNDLPIGTIAQDLRDGVIQGPVDPPTAAECRAYHKAWGVPMFPGMTAYLAGLPPPAPDKETS